MADVRGAELDEQIEALGKVRDHLTVTFGGSCIITEHGRIPVCNDPAEHEHDAHCFHAHFLVFPNAPDISGLARSYFSDAHTFSELRQAMEYAAVHREYVLVSPTATEFTIFTKPLNLPRQLARSLVAHAIHCPELADWRKTPNWDQAIQTAQNLTAHWGVSC